MPIIQVDHLTKEYCLGAMQDPKQTQHNNATNCTCVLYGGTYAVSP
jgi:hypothetical protein